MNPPSLPSMPLDLTPLLRAVEDACRRREMAPLMLLIGTLEAARHRCLRAVGDRMGQCDEPSQGRLWPDQDAGKVRDRWIAPQEGARRLGISVRTLTRRARTAPYSSFCIQQPKRGFKVSTAGLEEFLRREREAHGR